MNTKPRPAPSPAGFFMRLRAHQQRRLHVHAERRATPAPSWLALSGHTTSSTDIELLVLGHEVAVPRRTNPAAAPGPGRRALFVAIIRFLSPSLRGRRLVTPAMVLRGTVARQTVKGGVNGSQGQVAEIPPRCGRR